MFLVVVFFLYVQDLCTFDIISKASISKILRRPKAAYAWKALLQPNVLKVSLEDQLVVYLLNFQAYIDPKYHLIFISCWFLHCKLAFDIILQRHVFKSSFEHHSFVASMHIYINMDLIYLYVCVPLPPYKKQHIEIYTLHLGISHNGCQYVNKNYFLIRYWRTRVHRFQNPELGP